MRPTDEKKSVLVFGGKLQKKSYSMTPKPLKIRALEHILIDSSTLKY